MVEEKSYPLYHNPRDDGFWEDKCLFNRDIRLEDLSELTKVVPIGIEETEIDGEKTLVMVLSTKEGLRKIPIDCFQGLKVVKGDSKEHRYETDGELLIEFTYLNPRTEELERAPRRIRPLAKTMFGIYGDTDLASFDKGGHRARGESADHYLEGIDTQYDPDDPNLAGGLRRFPFWRIGIYGNSLQLAKDYLPSPPQ